MESAFPSIPQLINYVEVTSVDAKDHASFIHKAQAMI